MRTTARPDRARPISVGRLAMLAVAALVVPTVQAGALGAQTTSSASSDVAALRAQADDIANQYFHALSRSHELDDEIAQNAKAVDDFEAKAKQARRNARQRALLAYTTSGMHLATLVDGKSMLDTARRVQLIENVNQRDNSVYAKLKAATDELRTSRKALDEARTQQAAVVAQIESQAKTIDAKLAEAQRREQAAAVAAAAAAAPAVSAVGTTPANATSGTPTAPTTTTRPTTPTAPPTYSPSGGTHPHHDDPFLTCVRARESGGNYGAVNPVGPYLGAYQFYPSTWNASANHAGRPELVGVPANLASPYDQDDVAWALYQWQGPGPWGGRCG